jgi:adenylosuccinate synthase
MFRNGIRMIDLLEPDVFREKLEKGYAFAKGIIEKNSWPIFGYFIRRNF